MNKRLYGRERQERNERNIRRELKEKLHMFRKNVSLKVLIFFCMCLSVRINTLPYFFRTAERSHVDDFALFS